MPGRRQFHHSLDISTSGPPSTPTVLVTGGAKGLGRAFAEELGRAGGAVVITGRDERALSATRDELCAADIMAEAVLADATDEAAAAAAVDYVERKFGALDCLVNNAGLAGPVGPTWEIDHSEWWETLEVNLRGTMVMSSAALPDMVRRRRGRVINIVSHAGVHRWPFATAYSVSKAAVIKLTENLAAETRRYGVTVLSYDPGLVDIGITQAGRRKSVADSNEWERRIASWVENERVAGRMTPVAQTAAVLRRLAEGAADHRSGECITVGDKLEPRGTLGAE